MIHRTRHNILSLNRKLMTNASKRSVNHGHTLTRLDPTRTGMMRKTFISMLERQFAVLKGRIVQLVVDDDAFGLRDYGGGIGLPAHNRQLVVNADHSDDDALSPDKPLSVQFYRYSTHDKRELIGSIAWDGEKFHIMPSREDDEATLTRFLNNPVHVHGDRLTDIHHDEDPVRFMKNLRWEYRSPSLWATKASEIETVHNWEESQHPRDKGKFSSGSGGSGGGQDKQTGPKTLAAKAATTPKTEKQGKSEQVNPPNKQLPPNAAKALAPLQKEAGKNWPALQHVAATCYVKFTDFANKMSALLNSEPGDTAKEAIGSAIEGIFEGVAPLGAVRGKGPPLDPFSDKLGIPSMLVAKGASIVMAHALTKAKPLFKKAATGAVGLAKKAGPAVAGGLGALAGGIGLTGNADVDETRQIAAMLAQTIGEIFSDLGIDADPPTIDDVMGHLHDANVGGDSDQSASDDTGGVGSEDGSADQDSPDDTKVDDTDNPQPTNGRVENCSPGQLRGADGRCGPGIGLGIPRNQMPQIPGNKLQSFVDWAKSRSVEVTSGSRKAGELSPTQAEFDQKRVDSIPEDKMSSPCLISSDNYILDGTHRWVKHWQQDRDKMVPVLEISLPLVKAINLLRKFPDAKFVENENPNHDGTGMDGRLAGVLDRLDTTLNALSRFVPAVVNARQYAFPSSDAKIRAFQEWLKHQMSDLLTGQSKKQLWDRYIQEGFKKGAARSFDDYKRIKGKYRNRAGRNPDENLGWYDGTREQFLQESFAQPVSIDRVQMLAARSFDDLNGVTSAMSTQMSRTLMDGLVQGKSPLEVARDLNRDVDGIGLVRARVIARTELIRAHAEGQLVSLKKLGVKQLGVEVEYATAGDSHVCPECAAMEGSIYDIDKASGIIPMHPQCRCAWLPHVEVPGDDATTNMSTGTFNLDALLDNVFCATGTGGSIDATCSPGSVSGSKDHVEPEFSERDHGTQFDWEEKGATRTVVEAIHSYVEEGNFSAMNDYLRKGDNKDCTGKCQEDTEVLKKALDDAPKFSEPIQVHRSLRVTNRDEAKALLEKLETMKLSGGGVIKMDGFTSTSVDPLVPLQFAGTGDILLTIKATRGMGLQHYSHQGEDEILLPHGAKFKVVPDQGGYEHVWSGAKMHHFYLEQVDG